MKKTVTLEIVLFLFKKLQIEIINIIPIFARRLDFRRGLELLIVSMALGRTAGALIFYYFGF